MLPGRAGDSARFEIDSIDLRRAIKRRFLRNRSCDVRACKNCSARRTAEESDERQIARIMFRAFRHRPRHEQRPGLDVWRQPACEAEADKRLGPPPDQALGGAVSPLRPAATG